MLKNQNNMLVEDNSSQAQIELNEENDVCLLDVVINETYDESRENIAGNTPQRRTKLNSGMDMGTILRTGSSNQEVSAPQNTGALREQIDQDKNLTCSTVNRNGDALNSQMALINDDENPLTALESFVNSQEQDERIFKDDFRGAKDKQP